MTRQMSFRMTEPQVLARTKTVTRRLGWTFLKPGDELKAVDRCMGLKKGESPRYLDLIRVVSVRQERLDAITDEDVAREGYPGRTAAWFVEKFCRAMKCKPSRRVTRIEFEYVY